MTLPRFGSRALDNRNVLPTCPCPVPLRARERHQLRSTDPRRHSGTQPPESTCSTGGGTIAVKYLVVVPATRKWGNFKVAAGEEGAQC